jgi:hypothetical protein
MLVAGGADDVVHDAGDPRLVLTVETLRHHEVEEVDERPARARNGGMLARIGPSTYELHRL